MPEVKVNQTQVRRLTDDLLDLLQAESDDEQAFVNSLAALNATTAALLAHFSPPGELGMENVKRCQDTILELYQKNLGIEVRAN